jgi:DNA polymerase-4
LAGGLVLGLSYVDGRRWRGTRRLDATDDTLAFVRTMRSLWEQRPRRVVKPLKVGVTLIHVTEARGQSLELFAESRDRGRLNATVDALNRRFGAQAVYFGGAHGALDAAPMRIAFTRIPDPVTED